MTNQVYIAQWVLPEMIAFGLGKQIPAICRGSVYIASTIFIASSNGAFTT